MTDFKDKDNRGKGKGKRAHSDIESEPETYVASDAFAVPALRPQVRWVLNNGYS